VLLWAAMKLGEMLLRDGRLSPAQLQTALSLQARDGGRLGTVLFELGFVDLDATTVYLGLELGIPIATGAMLERAKRSAVRLLQANQAFRHKCVPLVVQDRQLIAAVEDPHDLANLEQISQLTGYRVLPRVAPEVRIYYYVERYYGVPRPLRFVALGDLPRGDEAAAQHGLPAPPLPGLPPLASQPIAAPGPGLKLHSVPKMARLDTNNRFDDSEALELEAEDLIVTLDADDAAAAEQAPLGAGNRTSVGNTTNQVPAVGPPVEPTSGAETLAALGAAEDRNQIVGGLLGYAAHLFEGAVLFTVRDQLAFGWKATGNMPGQAHVDHILIPLESPSLFRSAIEDDDGVYSGALAPSSIHSYMYKVLGCPEPAAAAVGLIRIGKRAVNLLYGHRSTKLNETEENELRSVCAAAAAAYARLIAVAKKKG
jgi:Type II secretion system (T2SS), protein E, N-terminal domain